MEEFNVQEGKPEYKDLNEILSFAIVVYRERYFETAAFKSVKQFAGLSKCSLQVFIYDNTDYNEWNIQSEKPVDGISVFYHRDETNPGIPVAYNYMVAAAARKGAEWVVLLDQDTMLPKDALSIYLDAIIRQPTVLVKTPVIMVENKIFSPFKTFFKKGKPIKKISSGVLSIKEFGFINSGMTIKISLFFEVNGYNECVKIDFADFLFIDRLTKKIEVFEILDFSCEHHFSHSEKDIEKALVRYSIFINDILSCPRTSFKDRIGYFIIGLMHLSKLTLVFRSVAFYKTWLQQRRLKHIRNVHTSTS
jgi:GT2 family glycosyltransferase